MVQFYLLDSTLAACSVLSTPYTKSAFDKQSLNYYEPTGIYLRLYGRSVGGQSVVVQVNPFPSLVPILGLGFSEGPRSPLRASMTAKLAPDPQAG